MLGIPIVTQFNGDGIKKAMQSFKQLEGASEKAKFILKAGAFAGVAAFAALGTAAFQAGQQLLGFAKMAADDQKSTKQLTLSIKSSTKATDEQIQKVDEWIDTVQRATGVADDDLRPAYSRIVRSTKDLKKAQDLLRLSLDISAATGKPLQAVTEALSRAFDGSTTAVGKLGLGYEKAELKGMAFSDLQKDLETRFGGAALDKANTFEGVMARLSITMDELKETLGAAILPYLQKLAEYGIQVANAFGKDGVSGAMEELKFILQTLLYDENGQLNQVGQTINGLVEKLNAIAGFFNLSQKIVGATPVGFAANKIGNVFGFDPTPTLGTIGGFAPTINPGSLRGIRGGNAGVNVTVQTGIGDPVQIGRQVVNVINAYERRNGGR